MSLHRSNIVFALVALTLIGAVLLSGCVPAPATAAAPQAAGDTLARTITVVGRGEVKSKPDVATTTVGVEVLAPTVEAAMEQGKARMQAVVDALKKLGIADKDIQTSNFSINFERTQPDTPTPKIEGTSAQPGTAEQPAGSYRVSNMVQVTIRDLNQVGQVLDVAVKAGANNVWGINFGLENTSNLEGQARAKAIDDAKARAQDLARLNGVDLGSVVAISEVVTGGSMPVFADAAMAKGLGGGGAPVEPGELTFATQIQVIYTIR